MLHALITNLATDIVARKEAFASEAVPRAMLIIAKRVIVIIVILMIGTLI